MDIGQLVELLKIKLGIASNSRDKTLEKIENFEKKLKELGR